MILRRFSIALISMCLLGAGLAVPENIKLDWSSVELAIFEETNGDGTILKGLTVYVPGNRIANEEDFVTIVPDFCATRLKPVLALAAEVADTSDLTLLRLQIDFYGPKIGENQTYVGAASSFRLENGECSL